MSNVVEYNRQDLFPSAKSSMLSGKRKRDTFKHGTKRKKTEYRNRFSMIFQKDTVSDRSASNTRK